MLDGTTYTFDGLALTPTEYRLLAALEADRGRVVSHRELIRAGWNAAPDVAYRACLRVSIAQLRRKLGDGVILNRPWYGYALAPLVGRTRSPETAPVLRDEVPVSSVQPAGSDSQTSNWEGGG